jgi:hypothetical protein
MFAATPNLIPKKATQELNYTAFAHNSLETLLVSPMPFHSTVESPSADSESNQIRIPTAELE